MALISRVPCCWLAGCCASWPDESPGWGGACAPGCDRRWLPAEKHMPGSSSCLAELLNAGRRGDSVALGELLRRYQPWLLILARLEVGKRLRGKCDASDVVQQTLLEACRAFANFRGRTEAELQ